uniref:Uncharacterized protein n=1 Tax=viral metagenome TaxID=1070528 RepID=A0A6M3K2Y9_9ZZZZ
MPGGIVVKKFSGKVLKAVFDSFKPEKRMVKEAGRAWSSGEHGGVGYGNDKTWD